MEVKRVVAKEGDALNAISSVCTGGGVFPLRVTGTSMVPFLSDGRDTVFLTKPADRVNTGDICLYRRNDRLILHRVIGVGSDGFIAAGDNQDFSEGPIGYDRVIALAIGAERRGRIIDRKSPIWFFYATIWRKTFGARRKLIALWQKHNHKGESV